MNNIESRIKAWKGPTDWLDLTSLNLKTLPIIPKNVKKLDVSFNKLINLNIPNGIEEIRCVYNDIKVLEIPYHVVNVWCSNNYIHAITFCEKQNEISNETYTFDFHKIISNIITFDFGFKKPILTEPSKDIKLEILYCNSNKLTCLPKLPNLLKELDCSDNYIKRLPKLPKHILKLWTRQFIYQYLPKRIPVFCTTFDFVTYKLTNKLPIFGPNLENIAQFQHNLKITSINNCPIRKRGETVASWHKRVINVQVEHRRIERIIRFNEYIKNELTDTIG